MSLAHYIPDISVLIKFSAASLALFLVPGPDMVLCLSKTIAYGRKTAFFVFLGITCGLLIHTLLAAFSVSALLVASQTAFFILRILGALYLIWLAVNVLRNGSKLNIHAGEENASAVPSFMRSFMTGLGVNLTNPKVILFFITFLPQFVSVSDPMADGKLMFLGVYFVLFTTPLMGLLILAADKFVLKLKRNPGILRIIDYLFSGVFISFAVGILFARR